MTMQHILIIDDDLTFAIMLKAWLKKKGYEVSTASNVKTAQKAIEGDRFDLILSDVRLPDGDGIELMKWAKMHSLDIPTIMMTSYAEIENVVTAMKYGATDYIEKPIKPDILLKKIADTLQATTPRRKTPNYIEGTSDAAKHLHKYVSLVAPTNISVLINGASGTGKEYVAQLIHRLSKRCDKPFVAIDCGAIPKELAASEFFGHIKGSFTGAVTDKTGAFIEANGGTIFLDEVGNLSYEVQVQLLRTLHERKVRPVGSTKEIAIDIRLITATNENLLSAISKGAFREDLYHRINEFTIQMPSLSERRDDIVAFADFFISKANEELGKNVIGFDDKAKQCLINYSWPGNIRQLKNVVRRAVLIASDTIIHPCDFSEELDSQPERITETKALRDANEEREKIADALRIAKYNKSRAAQILGIDRKTLYNKMKQYDI